MARWKLEGRAPTSNLQPPTSITQLAQDLVDSQCVRFGQFKLKSGIMSPIYLDLRRLVTHPQILKRVAQAYAVTLKELAFDRLAGIPYAALPIATAIALEIDRPLIYPRREAKDYGTKAVIEGDYQAGETIVVIDDLATTGGSKIEAIQKLEEAGLEGARHRGVDRSRAGGRADAGRGRLSTALGRESARPAAGVAAVGRDFGGAV